MGTLQLNVQPTDKHVWTSVCFSSFVISCFRAIQARGMATEKQCKYESRAFPRLIVIKQRVNC